MAHGGLAGIADDAHQPLGQKAVERRDEVVRVYAHIHESPQHVHNVVSVYRSENQVAGERRLYGDLRCLLIANLADHDLIWVVAQNGTQSAGKREALFLVHRNLGDAANLVLHRIFNRDDLVFVGLDFVQPSVQRSGFSAARGAGNQHHAIGLCDEHPEALDIVSAATHNIQHKIAQLLTHEFLVDHAQHSILAMNRGHNGNTKINGTPAVSHPKPPVLGNAALRDIEFTHDLDTGNDV